ncbi:MAG: glycolate oxidase subunit GlcF [Burkholderiales bacterium]|nr:glycolate oxidase subunit GlcF [Burkholderiales bacterium]
MQTNLADLYKGTRDGAEAEAILRKCVHCGFCTATCPTYQLLGDELDGPRGRIYLIKQVLEGHAATRKTQSHLDRCLTCRNCESTCPSGVDYGRLVDIGRKIVAAQVPRAGTDRLKRTLLARGLNSPLFAPAMKLGQAMRWAVPAGLKAKVPAPQAAGARPAPRHARRMLLLEGCVQNAMAPNINNAAARVLDRLGVSLVAAPGAGCCGALNHHLDFQDAGLDNMRRNIDAWWPAIAAGEVEALAMTASGCGVMVRDYGHLLAADARYAEKAARVSAMTRDLSELVIAEPGLPALLARARGAAAPRRIAYHPPCTLQHGQQVRGKAEQVLRDAGFELVPVAEAHLCCGSAGAYSVLNPEISTQLRDRKLAHLEAAAPEAICSANIGCLTHLQSGTATPVRHWVEVIDDLLAQA